MVWILIEVLEILFTRQLGDPWRLNAFLLDDVPVDTLEPGLILNVFGAAAQASQSLREILLQKTGDQRAARHRYIGGKFVVADGNALVDVVRICIIKRRVPVQC